MGAAVVPEVGPDRVEICKEKVLPKKGSGLVCQSRPPS
jgi:hypothetical protein